MSTLTRRVDHHKVIIVARVKVKVHWFGSKIEPRFKGSDTNAWPCRGAVVLHLPVREVLPFAGDGTVTAIGEDRCVL